MNFSVNKFVQEENAVARTFVYSGEKKLRLCAFFFPGGGGVVASTTFEVILKGYI